MVFISNQLVSSPSLGVNSKSSISFKHKFQVNSIFYVQPDVFLKATAFQTFVKQISKGYPNEKIMNVLMNSTTSENFLGSGRCAKVYKIPNVPDFVVRVLHNTTPEKFLSNSLKEIKDEFPNHNLGQKIADNFNGVTILRRVMGTSQGFSNPGQKDNAASFLEEHARKILSQITGIAMFPQKSYDDFALKVKEVNKSKKYVMDCLNPNNLLVDKVNLRFNIVDLAERKTFKGLENCKQDSGDMISLLLNIPFHKKAFDKLPTLEEKLNLRNNSKVVIKKVLTAAKNVGLEASQLTGARRFKLMNDFCLNHLNIDYDFLGRYRGFKELYWK